jgi:hypothetical protein
MAHVVTEVDTTASPERVIGALTDFSSRRLELWPNIDRKYYKVAAREEKSAEVIEGSPVFGQDSNAFEPGSFWVYEVTAGANGGSMCAWSSIAVHAISRAGSSAHCSASSATRSSARACGRP